MLLQNQPVRTFSEEREAIETRLVNMFDTESVPVQFGNVSVLKQGSVSVATPYRGRSFIRVSLAGGASEQREVSRSITTVNGVLNIGVFTAQDIGSDLGRTIADQLFPVFNAVTFNGITTGPATVRELPPNNGWYQLNFSVPYVWYRCIPA